MAMDDTEFIDDVTIGLQMQQFFDEWNYRVLSANMAVDCDRTQAIVAAMDLFEAYGLAISQEEKWDLATADEEQMIEALVAKMDPQHRRSFEHFTLQLQLIVSMVSRARCALDEGDAGDVQRIVEDGDRGITQHILKQVVIEAASQVGELREICGSWTKNMGRRLDRLCQVAQSTKQATEELTQLTRGVSDFAQTQNDKSKKVLMSLSDASEKTLLKTVMSSWRGHTERNKTERDIHAKFQKEIEDMKATLLSYKTQRIEGVKKALLSRAEASGGDLLREVLRCWARDTSSSKQAKEQEAKVAAQEERLSALRASQKTSAKRTMARVAEASENGLRALCFHSWIASMDELRLDRQVNQQTDMIQKQLNVMKAKSKNESSLVLSKMQGTTDQGLLSMTFGAWSEDYISEKKAREFEKHIAASEQKFTLLKSAQSGKAEHVAQRAIELEKDNLLMHVLMNWHSEVKLQRLIKHYGGKMNAKKEQLEAVRMMFNKFANELGEISNTPRKGKSERHGKAAGSSQSPARGAPRSPQEA